MEDGAVADPFDIDDLPLELGLAFQTGGIETAPAEPEASTLHLEEGKNENENDPLFSPSNIIAFTYTRIDLGKIFKWFWNRYPLSSNRPQMKKGGR